MGTLVPPTVPEIDPDKWYRVTEWAYQGSAGIDGCFGGVSSIDKGCIKGNVIKAHFAEGNECKWFLFLLAEGSPNPKRVVDLYGPYDTFDLCVFDL